MVLMMPAQYAAFDLSDITSHVQDYGPALQIAQSTLDRETLLDILNGHVFIPDEVLNDTIAKNINEDSAVNSIKVTSSDNGQLAVDIDTKKQGLVQISGTIKEFVHEGDSSYMVYHVKQRNIANHGLMSWVFSRISMSMAMRLAGGFDVPDNLPVTIKHNDIKIDYSQVLAASKAGQVQVNGTGLIDMIEVTGATPKDGGIDLQTKLNVPDSLKSALRLALAE